MKHLFDRAGNPERPRNVEELRRALKRSLSDLREGWRRCGNRKCRRGKHCFGKGADFMCSAHGGASRAVSPGPRVTQL